MTAKEISELSDEQRDALSLYRRRGLVRVTQDVLSDNPGFSKYGPVKSFVESVGEQEAGTALGIADDALFGCFSHFDTEARDKLFLENGINEDIAKEAIAIMSEAFVSRDERRLNSVEDTIDRLLIGNPSTKPVGPIRKVTRKEVAEWLSQIVEIQGDETDPKVYESAATESLLERINNHIASNPCPECEDYSATITEIGKYKGLTATRDALKKMVEEGKDDIKKEGGDPYTQNMGLFPGETRPGIFASINAASQKTS